MTIKFEEAQDEVVSIAEKFGYFSVAAELRKSESQHDLRGWINLLEMYLNGKGSEEAAASRLILAILSNGIEEKVEQLVAEEDKSPLELALEGLKKRVPITAQYGKLTELDALLAKIDEIQAKIDDATSTEFRIVWNESETSARKIDAIKAVRKVLGATLKDAATILEDSIVFYANKDQRKMLADFGIKLVEA